MSTIWFVFDPWQTDDSYVLVCLTKIGARFASWRRNLDYLRADEFYAETMRALS